MEAMGRSRWGCDFAAFLMLVAQSRARGAAVAMPAVRCPPSTATAQCACGFGAKARAGTKKFVRRGGREFFLTRNRCTARIPPQSPVTLHYHRTGRAARWEDANAAFCAVAGYTSRP